MSEAEEKYVVATHDAEDQRDHPVFSMFQQPVAFHRMFVDITGSVTAALMLSQAFYWSKKGRKGHWDGWFFKSAGEWEVETGLTRREQESARKKLKKFDWWQEKIAKAKGTPTLHYRINARAFAAHLRETQFDKLVKPNSTNCETPVTETTTETTTEEKGSSSSDFSACVAAYESNIGLITSNVGESIKKWLDDVPVEWVVKACGEASKYNKRSWAYAEKCLKNWQVNGLPVENVVEQTPLMALVPVEDASW